MRMMVTGCAGFIGSHLVERLLDEGHEVLGVDAFTGYYGRADKEHNLAGFADDPRFSLLEADLATTDVGAVATGIDGIFHLAAQPGVRGSFGEGFAEYVHHNVLATQRVFEGAIEAGVRRVVWASSSSVYGDAEAYPTVEATTPPAPRSPYGVTKRSCEDLAGVYRARGLETVGLRYFTVYGPRQRPDMAFRRLCEAAVHGHSFPLFGDGSQSRDFTYVTDAVDATYRAALADEIAPILNIGGGEESTLTGAIELLEAVSGRSILLERLDTQIGDVRRTAADTALARRLLGWTPETSLADGLAAAYAWVEDRALSLA
jgi:nucleoside-diphosphate-sugar epimerase